MGSRADGTNPRAVGTNPRARDPLANEDLPARELKLLAEADYARYRRTKHWRRLRAAVKRRADGRCENESCREETKQLDVHHLTYERVGEELLEDLLGLCRDCHAARHRKLTLTGGVLRDAATGETLGIVTEIEVLVVGEPLRRGYTSELPNPEIGTETAAKDGGPGEGNEQLARDIAAVWQRYIDAMEPRNRSLLIEERRIIRDALKVASVDECKLAIDGCKASPFHMGQNDRGKRYNRLSHILRGKRGLRTLREQIDMFIEVAEGVGQKAGFNAQQVTQAKRAVVQAYDMPGNGTAQERAREATVWLEENGWRVEEDPDGRPRFELA